MTVKERLTAFIKAENISQAAFEKTVGLSNGYVNNIRRSIQPEKIQRIAQSFPQLNTGWLLTGEGNMAKSSTNTNVSPTNNDCMQSGLFAAPLVPLLPISAQGGTLNSFVTSVQMKDVEKIISPISGADLAMTISGDSMAPEYPSGSKVFIKKIDHSAFIEWGKTYVLDTCNGVVVKRIIPGEKDNAVKCISINPDPLYAPFEVRCSDIYGMYKVMLCMAIK